MTPAPLRVALAALLLVAASGCDYARLLRPKVLKQLNPRVVRLVNFFPEVDRPNEAVLARLPGHGGLARAEVGADGVMRTSIRVPPDQYIWEPSVIVMPRAGELEVVVQNHDQSHHIAELPSSGERRILVLPQHRAGRIRVRLDQPGLYTFACPVANHGGRGMTGFILVRGETPPEARLDRPPQPRP